MKYLYFLSVLLLFTNCKAQQVADATEVPVVVQEKKEQASTIKSEILANVTSTETPYHQIPDYPENFEAQNVTARMVDGLGYRYYWATKDLRPEDLAYRYSETGITVSETLDHLYGLSLVIKNATLQLPNIRPSVKPEHTSEERREATLVNFKMASDQLKNSRPADIETFGIIFKRGEKSSEFPFWNLINGPIADAIYHTGQVAAFRRASGNPVHTGMNVFMGKTKE